MTGAFAPPRMAGRSAVFRRRIAVRRLAGMSGRVCPRLQSTHSHRRCAPQAPELRDLLADGPLEPSMLSEVRCAESQQGRGGPTARQGSVWRGRQVPALSICRCTRRAHAFLAAHTHVTSRGTACVRTTRSCVSAPVGPVLSVQSSDSLSAVLPLLPRPPVLPLVSPTAPSPRCAEHLR